MIESEKGKTINSLRKTVERLKEIVIETHKNSGQPCNISEKSKSSPRKIKKKHKENEKKMRP